MYWASAMVRVRIYSMWGFHSHTVPFHLRGALYSVKPLEVPVQGCLSLCVCALCVTFCLLPCCPQPPIILSELITGQESYPCLPWGCDHRPIRCPGCSSSSSINTTMFHWRKLTVNLIILSRTSSCMLILKGYMISCDIQFTGPSIHCISGYYVNVIL